LWHELDLVLAVIAILMLGFGFLGWAFSLGQALPAEVRREIHGTCVALFGALLGFAITGQAMMLTLTQDHPRLARLRQSTQYPVLWQIFTQAIVGLAVATLASFLALVFDRQEFEASWLLVPAVGAGLFALLRLARLIWALSAVVQIVTQQD
jgi:hypothetical protein